MKVIITDTHFCKSNNNKTVWEGQKSFIYKQFIPWLDELREANPDEKITFVHAGDLFENRSTVGTEICYEVGEMLQLIRTKVDKMVLIAGNHDYLTQSDSGEYNINSLDTYILPLFKDDKDVIINTQQDIYIDEHQVAYINYNNWTDENLVNLTMGEKRINAIIAHTDLAHLSPDNIKLLQTENIVAISGHIHIPDIRPNSYNLGSCFPLDFNDANGERCAYVFTDDCRELVSFLINTESNQFIRLYDDEILNFEFDKAHHTDKVELYINNDDYVFGKYNDSIKDFNKFFKSVDIFPYQKETSEIDELDVISFDDYNIEDIIENEIPKEYSKQFEVIKENLKA